MYEIVTEKGHLIVTKEKDGRLVLWEQVKKMIKHSVFRLFDGVLYARYDAVATPLDEYRAAYKEFVRQETQTIIQELVKEHELAYAVQNVSQQRCRRSRRMDDRASRRLSA